MSTAEQRKRLKQHYKECTEIFHEWEIRDYSYPPPRTPPFPEELRNMTCGAKTRAGTPCKRRDIYNNGRCKLHGGLSSGPITEEGKRRSALNGKLPKRKRTP